MKKISISVISFLVLNAVFAQNTPWVTTAGSSIGIGTASPQFQFQLHGTTDYTVTTPPPLGGGAPVTVNYGKTSRIGFTNSHPGVGATSGDGTQLRMSQANFSIENLEVGRIGLSSGNAMLNFVGSNGRAFFGPANTSSAATLGRLNLESGPDNGLYIHGGSSGRFGLSVEMNVNSDKAIQVMNAASGLHAFSINGSGQMRIFTDGLAATDDVLLIEKSGQRLLQLENSGLLYSREIKVNAAAWADYVFEPGYRLLSLDEVEAFITSEGHLPNVPAASDVLENGINVSEMNKVLMEKIEELTLYMIAQEKKNKEQEARILQLEESINNR